MVRASTKALRKRNRGIRRNNRDRLAHNDKHPDRPSLALNPELPLPEMQTIDFDLGPALLASEGFEAKALPLRELASRPLLRTAGDGSAAAELSYNIVFRGLPTLGAHTNLWVVDSYITDRDRNFARVADSMQVSPMAPAVELGGIVLTAFLLLVVLEQEAEVGDLPMASTVAAAAEHP